VRSPVFEDRDDARTEQMEQILETSLYAQIGPLVWRDEYNGPVHWMAVGSPDSNDPPYCEIPSMSDAQAYGADHTYCWTDFAYAYALTSDPIFLEKAKQAGGTTDLYTYMHESGVPYLATRAPMLALVQTLNGE
jgi:hypothetical protein